MFTELLEDVKYTVSTTLSRLHIPTEEEIAEMEAQQRQQQQQEQMNFVHSEASESGEDQQPAQSSEAARRSMSNQNASARSNTMVRQSKKVGRNEPCPCGSGKKYKQCHGKLL